MSGEDIEVFVGFYPGDGFWIDAHVDISDRGSASKLVGIVPELSVWADSEKFSAAACVDGLILLRVRHLANAVPNMGADANIEAGVLWWDEHLDYANALQICLESESIKCPKSAEIDATAIVISETCRVGFIDGVPVNRSQSSSRSMVSARLETAHWVSRGMEGPAPLEAYSSGWSTWQVVAKETVGLAFEKFKAVAEDADLVKRLSFIAEAKSAYAKNDFRVAFTLLWFVIESAAKGLSSRHPKGSKHRNASSVFEELREEGILSEDSFLLISALRGKRNKLVHDPGTTVCLPKDCMDAATAALELAVRDPSLAIQTKWSCGVEM